MWEISWGCPGQDQVTDWLIGMRRKGEASKRVPDFWFRQMRDGAFPSAMWNGGGIEVKTQWPGQFPHVFEKASFWLLCKTLSRILPTWPLRTDWGLTAYTWAQTPLPQPDIETFLMLGKAPPPWRFPPWTQLCPRGLSDLLFLSQNSPLEVCTQCPGPLSLSFSWTASNPSLILTQYHLQVALPTLDVPQDTNSQECLCSPECREHHLLPSRHCFTVSAAWDPLSPTGWSLIFLSHLDNPVIWALLSFTSVELEFCNW